MVDTQAGCGPQIAIGDCAKWVDNNPIDVSREGCESRKEVFNIAVEGGSADRFVRRGLEGIVKIPDLDLAAN
jgi:hypothetical protein